MLHKRNRNKIRFNKNTKTKGCKGIFTYVRLLFLIILSAFILTVIFVLKNSKDNSIWGISSNILIINSLNENYLSILSINKKSGEIIQVIVPGNATLDVSKGLGEYKAKNLYDLDRSQEYGGKLLVKTIQKSFYAPVYLWTTYDLSQQKIKNILYVIGFLFSNEETNIGIRDRISVVSYLITNGSRMRKLDMRDTNFLEETMTNGEEVFRISKTLPSELSILWANDYVSENEVRYKIVNLSEERLLPESIYNIFETTGAKLANIVKTSQADLEGADECLVTASDEDILNYYSMLFDCRKKHINVGDTIDFSITINEKYISYYK